MEYRKSGKGEKKGLLDEIQSHRYYVFIEREACKKACLPDIEYPRAAALVPTGAVWLS